MGADFYATTIVGVRIPTKKLYTKKRVKAFQHDMPEDWTVHPKTGKPLWKDEETFLLEDVVCSAYDWKERTASARGAKAAFVTSGDSERRSEWMFVGRRLIEIHVGHRDDVAKINDLTTLLEEKKFLEDLLTPLGVWNEREFGVWLVGYVSC